jgi:hypothetical protein
MSIPLLTLCVEGRGAGAQNAGLAIEMKRCRCRYFRDGVCLALIDEGNHVDRFIIPNVSLLRELFPRLDVLSSY